MAGWLPDPNEKKFPKTSHVGFGLVIGADGKRFRTRSTEVVRLGDLLDEAKSRSKSELKQRLEDNGKWYNYGFFFFDMEHSYSIETWQNRQSPDGLQRLGSSLPIDYVLHELHRHPQPQADAPACYTYGEHT